MSPAPIAREPGQISEAVLEKNVTMALAAPISSAAPSATITLVFPRPAKCELPEFEPNPRTTAEITSAATHATRPKDRSAPTIWRN